MRKLLLILSLLLLANSYADTCSVYSEFSPTEDVSSITVHQIENAKKSIHISAYGITNKDIVNALIKMAKEGVEVIVCSDNLQSKGKNSLLSELSEAGIPVFVKKSRILEHNKYIIIDNFEVLMGSWNFSNNANKQDNSQVIIYDCPGIVKTFEDDFQRIYKRDKN